MEEHLGAVASPSHARSVEAHADEVAHGALDGTRADVEIVLPEVGIDHSVLMLREVLMCGQQAIATALVAGPGLGDRTMCGGDGVERELHVSATKASLLLVDPRAPLARALGMQASGGRPQVLDYMPPIDAGLGKREELLLEPPDVLAAVGR